MHAAIKLQVTILKSRRVQLPLDLPEGRAEVIVLYPEADEKAATGDSGARKAKRSASATTQKPARTTRVSYFARLTARQAVPLSARASRALDEADRGER